jgi:hypothetical protein
MKDYYHKYFKYKIKYFEFKYGGSGKADKKNKDLVAKSPKASEVPASPITPLTVSAPPMTPQDVNKSTPFVSSVSSVFAEPGTPLLEPEPSVLNRLIEYKDELVCILLANPTLSNYKISARYSKKSDSELFINFLNKVSKKNFCHFSFHYPDESVDNLFVSGIRLGDMFEANTFHLKLDDFQQIVYNLDLKDLKLKCKFDDCKIEFLIGENNFIEIKKIIACFEEIFSSDKYKRILLNPTSRKLEF